MPLKIIKLLMTHPKIDRFEAEFAIIVTDQKRKISDLQDYDINEILHFIFK